jgi:preprotein translocase subunit SecA
MFKNIAKMISGDPSKQTVNAYSEMVEYVNGLEESYQALTDEALRAKTAEFKGRLAAGESLDELLAEAFAAVREASKRTIGLRPYDVQLMGGMALHQGKIAEMRTGEGKTLVATMPMYLNALTGRGVHLVTVNDYLARRDARWMAPIYSLLGLSVGVLQMSSRTEGGRFGYRVDLKKESTHEDQHQMELVPRAEAYAADIVYGTNNEFGFDYLRDNMRMTQAERVQRGHYYAIIDEVDNVLVDEARTPLIISGPAHDEAEHYKRVAEVVKRLNPEDYEINEKDRNVTLTELGEAHLEQLLGTTLRDPERPEDISPEQARLMGFVEQAMRAQYLFRRNKDYLVQGGQVVIIDEFTGRLMPGRRWSDGLHQAVEAKEGVKVEAENVTYATITIQNYFRMYEKLAGMTGTAVTEAEEFDKIYKLDVVALPQNVEYNASGRNSELEMMEAKDERGYKEIFYTRKDDPEKLPVLWKRKDYPDVVYRSVEAKLRAIVKEIVAIHAAGRPILVGTTSVESSDQVSNRLRVESIQRLLQVMLLRDTWLIKNNKTDDGFIIPELQPLYEPLEKLNAAELRQQARELGMNLNLQNEENLPRVLTLLGLQPEHGERLSAIIQGGVPHSVLNARQHTEESQIIAGAGAFGAVTIATNMAGRGVDIKLGGEIAEEVLSAVARVLRKAGHGEPSNMSLEEQRQAIQALKPEDYGIYKAEVEYFLKSVEEMAKVKELGGLHVIGSERHEARRIDNQLRGRAARQGDPGSSRFYLSLQDDLMRLFGGAQVEAAMSRMRMDDSVPLEYGLVTRIIEQSQTRVEGANFDARKHLLEYDDVLNTQRATVYTQRDRIMSKADLTEDVLGMLREEVALRVPAALADDEGPWKLLAWLEQIQPTLVVNRVLVPSFTVELLLGQLRDKKLTTADQAKAALLEVASEALRAEEEHLLGSLELLLESSQEKLDIQLSEAQETLDTFIQGLRFEEDGQQRNPAQLVTELSGLLHVPLKLSNDEQKLLRGDADKAAEIVNVRVDESLRAQAMLRLVGALERRLETELGLKPEELAAEDWPQVRERLFAAVRAEFEQRRERLIGANGDGVIGRELTETLSKAEGEVNEGHLLAGLMLMPETRATTFDKKTHKQVTQRKRRLSFAYHVAQFLEDVKEEEITDKVLKHLEKAQKSMQAIWGGAAWANVAQVGVAGLNESGKAALSEEIGDELESLDGKPLSALPAEAQQRGMQSLGKRALTESYRQLLLRVISELWIDYLTRMEALRISIRLEAYAQRDPLVEYKAQAFRMFQDLFADMRSSLVNRMFIFQPSTQARQAGPAVPAGQPAPAASGTNGSSQKEAENAAGAKEGGKRRRRRRK